MTNEIKEVQDFLAFWFAKDMASKWFMGGDAFDEVLRVRFGALHDLAISGQLKAWESSPLGRLALIILLDQVSRNRFRGEPLAYAQDDVALTLAKRALKFGDDHWLRTHYSPIAHQFIYLPLMHSESLADQHQCLNLYLLHGPEASVSFARQHLDVIERFNRFPSRNQVLGRESTPEEITFLQVSQMQWMKPHS